MLTGTKGRTSQGGVGSIRDPLSFHRKQRALQGQDTTYVDLAEVRNEPGARAEIDSTAQANGAFYTNGKRVAVPVDTSTVRGEGRHGLKSAPTFEPEKLTVLVAFESDCSASLAADLRR